MCHVAVTQARYAATEIGQASTWTGISGPIFYIFFFNRDSTNGLWLLLTLLCWENLEVTKYLRGRCIGGDSGDRQRTSCREGCIEREREKMKSSHKFIRMKLMVTRGVWDNLLSLRSRQVHLLQSFHSYNSAFISVEKKCSVDPRHLFSLSE